MKKTSRPNEPAAESWGAPAPDGFFPAGCAGDAALYRAARHRDAPYRLVAGEGFSCCEYRLRLNIFTFGRAELRLPFTIIGPPASVDRTGYYGSLDKLAESYGGKKGNHLVLNLPAPYEGRGACARTLSTAVLQNRFTDFNGYLAALRSPYRRRILLARKKMAGLSWAQIEPEAFDESLYRLYLQVLEKSDFPLETLGLGFFQNCPGAIYVLAESGRPLAFVLLEHRGDATDFLFGGMDYGARDDKDLYMNMLVKVVEEGIRHGSAEIHLGQTAEDSKRRLGAALVPRYMLYLSSSRILTALARFLLRRVEYRDNSKPCHVFREETDSRTQ